MTAPRAVWRAVGRGPDPDQVVVVDLDADASEISRSVTTDDGLAVLAREADPDIRWVWTDTNRWYPRLLASGVTVQRCHDLRLCRAILRTRAGDDAAAIESSAWNAPAAEPDAGLDTLFDLTGGSDGPPSGIDDVVAELVTQVAAVAEEDAPGRLRLLLAAESAGALIACELYAAGVPWDRAIHDAILTEVLGPRPRAGELPARVAELGRTVRAALNDPALSLDSQPRLLRALHRSGILVESTSRWELSRHEHPAVEPLLAYKRAMRLLTANGWAWMDAWVPGDRFRPVYVPGGVVTGRWASSGGGALQLPRMLRPAVRADPGWTLVVADVAQLEPRVLAAMSRDTTLADAARGTDLYAGMVDRGVAPTRQDAKLALLGAMYGATSGDAGRLMPALRRSYPRAMRFVDDAARTGENGGVVRTWLGRACPPAPEEWTFAQRSSALVEASEAERAAARRQSRDRGRFTRNFVVQGTAAEWALAWLADLRIRLAALPSAEPASPTAPGRPDRAHLAFFLHDEIIVHSPRSQAEEVAAAVQLAADTATRVLFGSFPLEFRLDLRIAASADKA